MAATPRLQVSDTLGRRIVPLDKALFRIGRRHESELQIVSVDVSREHAEIEQDGSGRWLLRDRNSRYGTFANDKAVTEHVLAHGDQIRLGAAAAPSWYSWSTTLRRMDRTRQGPSISGRLPRSSIACGRSDPPGCWMKCSRW